MENRNAISPELASGPRRRIGWLVSAIIAGILMLLLLIRQADQINDVEYQGRPLTRLLDDLVYPVGSTNHNLAAAAVTELGAKCLPVYS